LITIIYSNRINNIIGKNTGKVGAASSIGLIGTLATGKVAGKATWILPRMKRKNL
jgi:hypothetical protein